MTYYQTYWNTGEFVSELIAGFFVVLLLFLPMYFVQLWKIKNKNAADIITLVIQCFGVAIGIIIGKTIGDFWLAGGNAADPKAGNLAIGIGNSSGVMTLAFEFMAFKGFAYIFGANMLGGALAGYVSYLVFKVYNSTMDKKDKIDLKWIFSNQLTSWKTLFLTEAILTSVWLIGVAGIMGLDNVNYLSRDLLVSAHAFLILMCAAPVGFSVLALNFNLARWLVGWTILKARTKRDHFQFFVRGGITFAIGAIVGTGFHFAIEAYSAKA